MGRRKIEIQPIDDERNRAVTFSKRKAGLFKKAHELAILCKVDVALIIVGQNKKIYKYSSDSTDAILDKYRSFTIEENKTPEFYGDYSNESRIEVFHPSNSSKISLDHSADLKERQRSDTIALNNAIVTELHNDLDHQTNVEDQKGEVVQHLVRDGKRLQNIEGGGSIKRQKFSSASASIDDKQNVPHYNQNFMKRHTRSHSKNRPALSLHIPDTNKNIATNPNITSLNDRANLSQEPNLNISPDSNFGLLPNRNTNNGNNYMNSNKSKRLPVVTPTTQYLNKMVSQATELPSGLTGYFNLSMSPVQGSAGSYLFPNPSQSQVLVESNGEQQFVQDDSKQLQNANDAYQEAHRIPTSSPSHNLQQPQQSQQLQLQQHQQQQQQHQQLQQQEQHQQQQQQQQQQPSQQQSQAQHQQPYHPMSATSAMFFPNNGRQVGMPMATPGNGPLSGIQPPSALIGSRSNTPTLSAFGLSGTKIGEMSSPSGYFNQDNWPTFPTGMTPIVTSRPPLPKPLSNPGLGDDNPANMSNGNNPNVAGNPPSNLHDNNNPNALMSLTEENEQQQQQQQQKDINIAGRESMVKNEDLPDS